MTELGDPMAGERRRELLAIKLTALVTEHLGHAPDQPATAFGAGAALVHGGGAWVLVDGPADRALGPALAWALRHGPDSLDLVADSGGGRLARRAAELAVPVRVWFAENRSLLPVVADPVSTGPEAASAHLELIELIESAGAEACVERGVVTGEVRGLEVCRVVDEPTTGNFAELSDLPTGTDPGVLAANAERRDDEVLLEVGVGANDREAFQMLHGHLPTLEALSGVVSAVSEYRRADAMQHPLNRMAPERFLRWQVLQDPTSLGLESLEPVDPPVDRLSMKHAEPCVARGVDSAGVDAVVVFSVGVDLDLVAFVADVVASLRPDDSDRLIVVVPERDLLAITHELLGLLSRPVELVAAPPST